MLTDGIISKKEAKRFLELTQNLKKLSSRDIQKLNIEVKKGDKIKGNLSEGIF